MSKNSLTILERIKAAFIDTPVAPALPVAPADTTLATVAAYPVDGQGNVYVDISDDGVADIDAGDKVYSDPEMTVPYADGTYQVTGTDFGFTVVGGAVSTVVDADGTGPGTPITDTPPAPVTATVPPAPTFEERLAALEAKLNQPAPAPVLPTGMATEIQLQAAELKIQKHEKTIKDLFELVEKISVEPSAEPKTLNGSAKDRFDASSKKEKALERMAAQVKEMRTQKTTY